MPQKEIMDSYLPAYWRSVARPVPMDYGVVAKASGPSAPASQTTRSGSTSRLGYSHDYGTGSDYFESWRYGKHWGPPPVQNPSGEPARVGLCIPCDLASALVGAAGCNCSKALTLLIKLGAIHTARMHAADAAKSPNNWMPEDWYAHMEEEERLFFPLLPAAVAAQMIEEHHKFRTELKIYGRIQSDTILEQHSNAENAWAEYLMAHLEPGASGAKAAGARTGAEAQHDTISGTFVAALAIIAGLGILIADKVA